MKRYLLAIVVFCLALVSRLWAAEHTDDSLQTVRENLDQKKAILLDVREKREWDAGHLAGATLFPLSELKAALKDPAKLKQLTDRLPKDRIIYCHCGSGVRVLAVENSLDPLGYDVRSLSSGYSDLLDAGFPKAK